MTVRRAEPHSAPTLRAATPLPTTDDPTTAGDSVPGPCSGRSLGVVALALALGIGTAVGCATSDQVLQRKRERAEIEGDGEACYTTTSEECYSGAKGTLGRGICRPGRRSCDDGTWTSCVGEVAPTPELCNAKDDDCDGIVDNGFEHDGALCFLQGAKGACRTQGRWHCSEDGKSAICDAERVAPAPETCDGVDNDCDGEVDEKSIPPAQQTCSTGRAGVCDPGTNRCINGKVRCVQDVQPGIEICNRLDDNCNNIVDEDCVSPEEAAKLEASRPK